MHGIFQSALILRSDPQDRVSKDEAERRRCLKKQNGRDMPGHSEIKSQLPEA